jgi:hypothetical protein
MNKWDDPGEEVQITKDLYEVLGVAKDATDSQIKRAYHKMAMVHHPDKRASNPTGSDETFKVCCASKRASLPRLRVRARPRGVRLLTGSLTGNWVRIQGALGP